MTHLDMSTLPHHLVPQVIQHGLESLDQSPSLLRLPSSSRAASQLDAVNITTGPWLYLDSAQLFFLQTQDSSLRHADPTLNTLPPSCNTAGSGRSRTKRGEIVDHW